MRLKNIARTIAKTEAGDAARAAIRHKRKGGKFDRVVRITRLGQYKVLNPITRSDWELGTMGIRDVPSWDDLKDDDGAHKKVRMLLEPLEIWIETKYVNIIYRFERGFVWDLASVPKVLRSIVDNDDKDLMDAAICHDFNFEMWEERKKDGLYYFDYKQSNALFYEMVKKRAGWWKAVKCWLGVTNKIARCHWENNSTVFNYGKCTLEVRPR
jgi:hypothetical protein